MPRAKRLSSLRRKPNHPWSRRYPKPKPDGYWDDFLKRMKKDAERAKKNSSSPSSGNG